MKKTALVGMVAFVVGVVGFQHYAGQLEQEAYGGEPVEVLVVTQDAERGAQLTEEMLAVAQIPSGYVEHRRLRADQLERVTGAELAVALHAGDGLLESDLDGDLAPEHLATLVTPGRRAYSLPDGTNSFHTLLEVGDRVDVLVQEGATSRTLLEDVRVLSVGERLHTDQKADTSGSRNGVTISVTRLQSQSLLAAETRGRLRLTLRHPEDEQPPRVEEQRPQSSFNRASGRAVREIEHVR